MSLSEPVAKSVRAREGWDGWEVDDEGELVGEGRRGLRVRE